MNGIITTKRLGTFGRWGNSLGLYSFAKKYAEMHNCQLQTPSWLGQKVFTINDPPITVDLPQTKCDEVPWGKVNIDLLGYYQNTEYLKHLSISWLKKLFTFRDEWKQRFPKKDEYYIAAHIRRGDYAGYSHIFALIQEESYINACRKFGLDETKIVWVREDKPTIEPDLDSQGIGFLPDFMKIVNANVILRANSTFSWWAGTLSEAKIYSPVIGDARGVCNVDYVEGNWPRIANFKKWEPECPQNHGDLHIVE
jgi:hypothetical protein